MNGGSDLVLVDVNEDVHVAELRFNRPGKGNAITGQMEELFFARLREVTGNPRISCVIISGEGRGFSGGYDIGEHVGSAQPASAIDDWREFRGMLERWLSVRNAAIPVIAAIHGYCFGIATVLGSMADLVVIAEDAQWGAAQLRAGGGSNGPPLALLVGQRKAREIEYRAARLTGTEAVAIGWANYAVPAAEVRATAWELAEDIARTPREALEGKKAAFNRLMDHQGLSAYLEDAALLHTVLNYSAPVQALKADVAAHGFGSRSER